ncbi:multidrug effflux MFS transporter [Edwardsiella tarda]|uniref:multidrug effflux MFS transporter n=1 Tax=Edwardsiella tarda TaxID=636 RepID=UPI0009BD88ED|nr:multidrug effflux MFS transporter [Edwardsiella tarda]
MSSAFVQRPPRWLIPLLGSLVAFGPLSIDMYLPALPAMAQRLQATTGQMQLTLSAFFLGLCIGMLLYGPLSDRLGRRRLLLSGLLLFACASLLCTQVSNVWQLVALRVLQAFGSGAAVVMARSIARDVYHAQVLPRVLSLMTLVTMAAPLLAPLLGGALLTWFDWQAIFGLLTLCGCLSGLLVWRLLPETLPTSASPSSGGLWVAFHHYGLLLRDRRAMAAIGTLSFSFAGMFAFISASPFVYIRYFQLSPHAYGLLFAGNVLGMILLLLLNVRLLRHYSLARLLSWQSGAQVIFGLLLLASYRQGVVLIAPLVMLYISLVNAIGANSLSQLLLPRAEQAGSATALAVSCQFALGAGASLLLSALQDDTPFTMTLLMALCAALSWLSQRLAVQRVPRHLYCLLPGERNHEK